MALGRRVVGEVVPQVPRQVEPAAPLGDPQRVLDGLRAALEQRRHLLWRFEVEVAVWPTLPMGLFKRFVVVDRHEGVLESVAVLDVVVDVVGGHDACAKPASQVDEPPVATGVALHQVLLKFDEDAVRDAPVHVGAKLRLSPRKVAILRQVREPTGAAAREQYQSFGVLGDTSWVQAGITPIAVSVAVGDKPGQVGVAALIFGQEGQVRAVLEGHLCADDGIQVEVSSGLGELHGATQVVVVGDSEGTVSEPFGAHE